MKQEHSRKSYPFEYGFGAVTSGEKCVYLHLHEMPESGVIALSDVTEMVSSIEVLGSGRQLEFIRERVQLVITLPCMKENMAENGGTNNLWQEETVPVIKVSFEENVHEHTKRVIPLHGAMSLSPCDGTALGNIAFRKSGAIDDGWTDTTGAITYELIAPGAGRYHLSMVSGLLDWKGRYCKGNRLMMTVNEKDYEFVLNDDHLLDSYLRAYYVGFCSELGEIELKEGNNVLTLRVEEFATGNEVGLPIMNLFVRKCGI